MDKFNLEEYLTKKNFEYSIGVDGHQINLKMCPHCGDEKWHFYINGKPSSSLLRSHPFWCHKCSATGNIVGFIMAVDGLSYQMAVKFLLTNQRRRNQTEIGVLERKPLSSGTPEENIEPLSEITMPVEFMPLTENIDYTAARGLTDEAVQYFQLKFCSKYLSYESIQDCGFIPQDQEFTPQQATEKFGRLTHNRLILPVIMDGKVVGWQARAIDKRMPKYLNSRNFKKSQALYNHDIVHDIKFKAKHNALILCEGPFDVIACHMAGYRAVATFGKHVSNAQIGLLLRLGIKKVIIGLDPDAIEDAQALYKNLCTLFDTMVLKMPEDIDLGDCAPAQIDSLIRSRLYRPSIGGLDKKTLT